MPRDHAFRADWLALREPVDHRSRNPDPLEPLADAWRTRGWSRVLDLGTGTGSNFRYLTSRLPGPQHWTLLDKDADLLARAGPMTGAHGASVRRVRADLLDAGAREAAAVDLVTGSALLDLVSEAWLTSLVQACAAASCAVYFALTYDGQIAWTRSGAPASPTLADGVEDAESERVRRAVNAHQRRDKGFGPALGPTAAFVADELLRAAAYRTWLQPSPWRLGPGDEGLALRLVDGWEQSALEESEKAEHVSNGTAGEAPELADALHRIHDWAQNRRRAIEGAACTLTVGHLDLLASPPEAT